jgi:2-polyprenyl-3-methyl-5-hydroxy-6-metoxy-1,4-benzoquinol methylase
MVLCEVCGSDNILVIPSPTYAKNAFGKCADCALLQNFQTKTASNLEGQDFDDYTLDQDLIFEKLRRARVLSQIENHLIKNELELSVFDIGTGAGYFLADAEKMGFKVSGSELSRTAARQVCEKYGFEVSVKIMRILTLKTANLR